MLVVDDDRVARHLAASALAAAGVETVEAVTGRQALDLLAHGTFAAVLLDNHMPGLSGLDVLGAIRAEPATRTLPVLLVTADEDVTDRVRGLRAGASDYLVKPYDPDELVARVEAHLENQTAWSEVVESHLAQRAAMAEAVRQAGRNATPESLADIVCAELQRGGRRSGVVVIGIVGDAVALPLAARDIAAWNVEPGRLLPPALARYLVDRGEHGPWLEHLDDAGAAALPGGPFPDDATMACAPITWNGDLLGVLMVRVDGTGRRAGGAETSAALREVVDFAGVAAGLLGLPLYRQAERERRRRIIDEVLARRAFRPVFQPIVRLSDGEVVGYEALTRFDDGADAELRFAQASSIGLGVALELATMTAALDRADALPPDRFVTLNVSAPLIGRVAMTEIADPSGRRIVLELSEHERIDDYDELGESLRALRPAFGLAVDDAGSGFASLRHVLTLGPDFMKLDQSWVKSIHEDQSRQALVSGLVGFAASTGAELIAEGVESADELATLRRLGVGFGQGFHLAPPAELGS